MAQDPQFTMEAFTAHAVQITKAFEERRIRFLHKLKFRAVLACVLLFAFPFWFTLLTRWDYLGNGLSAVGTLVVHVMAAIILIISIIVFAVHPLFRYRYDTLRIGASMPGSTGVVNQPMLLKQQLFTQLLGYFGAFTMYGDRKLSLRSFRSAPNLPEFDSYDSSDYIRGQFNGVNVEISEVHLKVQRESSQLAVFSGLFIVLDINDTNLVLRGKFDGKTVVLQKHDSINDFVAEKYDGYKRVSFTESSFTQKLEAYSTVQPEAERLLSEKLLRSFLKISDVVMQSKNQSPSVDDKIAYALERMAEGLGDMMAAMAGAILSWFKTGSFRVESSRHSYSPVETNISKDAKAFALTPQCAFFNDKLLISIPSNKNLFEPDSVFHKPLTQEDITLAFAIMGEISDISKAVVDALPKEVA